MVHRCCISSCGMNVRVAEAKGLSYHGFPNKEPLREQWIQAILPHLDKPETFKVVAKYTRVCSRHFRKKDFSMDIKKRARLNSNAVPSVFPRKNSPVIIPNVLSSPSRSNKTKGDASQGSSSAASDLVPTSAPTTTTIVLSTSRASEDPLSSAALISWTLESSSEDGNTSIESSSLPREYLIESATLTDDQLTLTVREPDGVSSSSISQEDLSQSSNFSLNEDSNESPHKKRKRRKWNRSAFDRPAKDKKKLTSDDTSIDGVEEALAEISLSTFLTIDSENRSEEKKKPRVARIEDNLKPVPVPGTEGPKCLQTVSLPLDNSTVQNMPLDQVQHLSSIEQELLQSIQAVSLHCGTDPENGDAPLLENQRSNVLSFNRPVHPFMHHSSEESIFSTEDEGLDISAIKLEYPDSGASAIGTELSGESENVHSIMTQIVGLDNRVPTVLEIENLAHHFNNSLFTEFNSPITLSIGLEDLHLPTADSIEQETPSTASSSSEDIHNLFLVENLKMPDQYNYPANSTATKSANSRKKKISEDIRLVGVTKKHKKEKISGARFSVERFSNSDKDIEYYTGFSSYRNFEGFFRSLEAYVERLRVTDVMFGVANLDKLPSETDSSELILGSPSILDSEFILPLPPPPAFDEPQKRRPFHGRSMTRIDELFMTVIRLRRKLPEKVLGHMFCISQPTVSRIIRAWTVLLSKLIDCYPVEGGSDAKQKSVKTGPRSICEHSYTSRGLGLPDSFRQLFHSELAKSIVVTSVSAKDKKTLQKTNATTPPATCTTAKRQKKTKSVIEVAETDTGKDTSSAEANPISSARTETVICDLLDHGSDLMFNQIVGLEVEGSDYFQPAFLE